MLSREPGLISCLSYYKSYKFTYTFYVLEVPVLLFSLIQGEKSLYCFQRHKFQAPIRSMSSGISVSANGLHLERSRISRQESILPSAQGSEILAEYRQVILLLQTKKAGCSDVPGQSYSAMNFMKNHTQTYTCADTETCLKQNKALSRVQGTLIIFFLSAIAITGNTQ